MKELERGPACTAGGLAALAMIRENRRGDKHFIPSDAVRIGVDTPGIGGAPNLSGCMDPREVGSAGLSISRQLIYKSKNNLHKKSERNLKKTKNISRHFYKNAVLAISIILV